MPSLDRLNPRFASRLKTTTGVSFRGTLQPADEGAIPSYDFVYPRLTLRVHKDEPCATRDTFTDAWGRHHLIGDHDMGMSGDNKLYRTHRVFQTPFQLTWKRPVSTTDTLTGFQKTATATPTDLGTIWASVELYGREAPDQALRVQEEIRRIITGSAIALGDIVDGSIVKRLVPVFGVWLAEIQ